jgi:hypothetical protein
MHDPRVTRKADPFGEENPLLSEAALRPPSKPERPPSSSSDIFPSRHLSHSFPPGSSRALTKHTDLMPRTTFPAGRTRTRSPSSLRPPRPSFLSKPGRHAVPN